MEPQNTQTPTPVHIEVVTSAPRQRHFLATFFISFMWGTFGADRMYMGFWGLGILKLITAGGFGIWTLVDLVLVMGGHMRDKQGREMLQYAEYKKFAYKTVLICAAVLGVVVLVNGVLLILGISQLFTMLTSGEGLPSGLDSLFNGAGGGIPPELQQELNI